MFKTNCIKKFSGHNKIRGGTKKFRELCPRMPPWLWACDGLWTAWTEAKWLL